MNFEQYFISTRRMAGKALATIIGIERAIKEGHTVLLASQDCQGFISKLNDRGYVEFTTKPVESTDRESKPIIIRDQILIYPA
jgi:hypothetical protein